MKTTAEQRKFLREEAEHFENLNPTDTKELLDDFAELEKELAEARLLLEAYGITHASKSSGTK